MNINAFVIFTSNHLVIFITRKSPGASTSLEKHDGESEKEKWPQPGNSVLNDTQRRNSRHLLWFDSSHCFHPDLVTVSPPLPHRRTWRIVPSGLRVLRLSFLRTDGSGRLLFRLLLLLKKTIPTVWHRDSDELSRAGMFPVQLQLLLFLGVFFKPEVSLHDDSKFLHPKISFFGGWGNRRNMTTQHNQRLYPK